MNDYDTISLHKALLQVLKNPSSYVVLGHKSLNENIHIKNSSRTVIDHSGISIQLTQ